MIGRRIVALLGVVALAGGAPAGPIRADPSLLAPWTTKLRDRQRDDPYLIVYRRGDTHLIFVAAEHENAVDSPTFRLIARAFALWPIRSVIVEGTDSDLGADPPELIRIATRPHPDPAIDPDGETGPAVRGAIRAGARLYGGEAGDLAVRDRVRRAGIDDRDLLGFYVLRVVPQWMRDGSIAGPADPGLARLVEAQLRRSRTALMLPPDMLPGFDSFADWYRRLNGKPLAAGVEPEETGPLVDGPWSTNRIGAAIARARDAHLVNQIADRLNADKSVLVVFGGSHAAIERPVLDRMIGRPCYVGSDIGAAAARCR